MTGSEDRRPYREDLVDRDVGLPGLLVGDVDE